jgi:23S rRNA (cytidine1920-2'-O)/16S rRNA (cytidine1409-2'-O)-methyltransferase
MSRSRADLLLVARGLFDSRARARAAIEAGLVSADGVVVTKPAELIDEMAEVIATAPHPWVGRGALKLVHALELWPLDLAGRIVLDVGASTGGFTEVCLARGAGRVFAVDVGRDQLHSSLRSEPRVVSLEGTDARNLTTDQITTPPDLVVCDASFIGLAKVLPVPLSLARLGADLIALVKPQFEVGPDRVGKGGLVKDEAARAEALSDVVAFIQDSGWDVLATADSPIVGGDGNHEFLLHARKSRPA